MSDILSYWSHPTSPPRDTQIAALEWAAKQTAKYLILEVPVGGGKSHIGVTFGNFIQSPDVRKSFILTPQKILQKQYEDSFPKTSVFPFYGKNNYTCKQFNTTCDIGSTIKASGCDFCPYKAAKEIAKGTPHVVMNYKLALLSFLYAGTFTRRPLMILDECHNSEEELTELDAIEITEYRSKRYGIKWKWSRDIASAMEWIKVEYYPVIEEKAEELEEKTAYLRDRSAGNLNANDVALLREYKGLVEHAETVAWLIEQTNEQIRKDFALINNDKTYIKFKRLFARFSFHHVLNPQAERFLFMSSTILNHKGFCSDLGLDFKDSAFLSMNSEFPPGNRPVIFLPTMKMNKDWSLPENRDGRDRMVMAVSHILEAHEKDSGIIHTSSFAISKWLTDSLQGIQSHEIMHHNPDSGDKRDKVIEAFKHSPKPCVLLSPSITEGLDLVDDTARFAIFVKVPFPYLGDQWVSTRMSISEEWYQRQALINIIQGGGRVVRSKVDWGYVYILDASWAFLLSRTRQAVPHWWMEAYKEFT